MGSLLSHLGCLAQILGEIRGALLAAPLAGPEENALCQMRPQLVRAEEALSESWAFQPGWRSTSLRDQGVLPGSLGLSRLLFGSQGGDV